MMCWICKSRSLGNLYYYDEDSSPDCTDVSNESSTVDGQYWIELLCKASSEEVLEATTGG